jgi:FixJ family two-component response regulator
MIAVLDDDEPVRKAVVRLLRSAGFTARSFASGGELLAEWVGTRPECLVLDLQMPGTSGLEVQRTLRSAGEEVPTILMTASDESELVDECMAAGACLCLRKPLEGEQLLEALERIHVHREGGDDPPIN